MIYFNDRKPLHWLDFCHAVLHEAGHLAQFRDPLNHDDSLHSHLAASVMYAVVLLGNDPRCRDRGRPFLERHGLLTHRQH